MEFVLTRLWREIGCFDRLYQYMTLYLFLFIQSYKYLNGDEIVFADMSSENNSKPAVLFQYIITGVLAVTKKRKKEKKKKKDTLDNYDFSHVNTLAYFFLFTNANLV